jgi:hypothetical protein
MVTMVNSSSIYTQKVDQALKKAQNAKCRQNSKIVKCTKGAKIVGGSRNKWRQNEHN